MYFIRTKKQYRLMWKIYELMKQINRLDPTQYPWKEQEKALDAISTYNQKNDKYLSGHNYGVRK